jgi:1,4-dihydroxy-2-naphthoate octaprenyltransferase
MRHPSLIEKSLFQKAAFFSNVALTFIDNDGYPFSVPVDCRVDTEREVVQIVNQGGMPSLGDREVGLIFNHITPLPMGGYTDRRYIVFWGRINEDGDLLILKPTKGFMWDEKEVPFFQYSEMRNSRARRYLELLKEKPWLSTPWLILRTFRLPFVIATILPIALGAAIAFRSDLFDWILLVLTMIGALLLHLGVNTANDYFDARMGADDINITPTPYSGGSRIIQYGLLPASAVFSLSTASYIGGILIGLYLTYLRGWPIAAIGLLGLLVSYGYTAPPFKWAYRGVGEIAVAVGFGPLLVLGSYFVQTQSISTEALLASLVPGLLVMLILYVNEIPDRTWDDEAGKRTLVARMSERSVVEGYQLSLVALYAIILLGVLSRLFPPTALLALFTIPVAVKVRNLIKENLGNPYGLMPAMSKNIKLYTFTTLLMLVGYVLSFVLE